jgi:hypothetical protein
MNVLDYIKQKVKTYDKPTPRKMRRLGDALLAASTMAAGYAGLSDYPKLSAALMIVGVVGKFLTNFYADE